MQHSLLAVLNGSRNKAIWFFSFAWQRKAPFVSWIIKEQSISPYIVNWYLSFLSGRKQRVLYNGMVCDWWEVYEGTTQGSVGEPYFFHIFLNDLHPIGLNNASLIKCADGSSLLIAVNEQRDNSEMFYRSS